MDGGLGPPPMPGDGEGGVPSPIPVVGIKNKDEGRNAAGGGAVPSACGTGLWGIDAGALAAGGGAVRDETRSTGCAGNGAALRSAAAEATQPAVAIARGSFSQAARVPVQTRQVQVTRSNTIMRMMLARRGWWCGEVLRGSKEPVRG